MVLQSNTYHRRLITDPEKGIVEKFTYDSQNRLLTHTHQVGSNPVEYLTQNKYNELSQLESKKVGGISLASPLQTIDYKYNIRGWMTKINDPINLSGKLFGYELRYHNPVNTTFAMAKYNGNIAEVDWKTSNDGVLKRYSYNYDKLNRLKFGHYSEPNSTVPLEDHFGESIEYDLNGNITRLYRNAKNTTNGMAMQIDNLTYNYAGNRLLNVMDASQNYSGYVGGGNTIGYDLNGNMTTHADKGITNIQYNFLNLPSIFTKNNNTSPFGGIMSHLYGADGRKLKKVYSYYKKDWQGNTNLALTTTDYLDSFQYVLEGIGFGCIDCPPPTPDLQFVLTSEGYFDFVKNKYIYNYTDHLGNIRLSYFNNGNSTEVLEENNYYPFGLKHEGVNVLKGNPTYQYKYNGKEYQQEIGMYDYGARFYMPDLGRWGVVDPLAEKMTRHSPYNYAFNNPIRFIDPDGRQGEDFVQRKDGSIYWDKNANSQATTKSGETYLGKELTFKFNSYIDKNLWDGPTLGGIVDASGDKLTSTLKLSARENDAGELTSLVGNFESKPGETPVGTPRMFYPGEGGSNNVFTMNGTSGGININFEQHASVSPVEEYMALRPNGFKIVDVAQKLDINYNSSNGNLSVGAYTNIFPSANLTVSGNGQTSKLMQYNQPSFPGTHSAPKNKYNTYDYSYYPSKFYKRN